MSWITVIWSMTAAACLTLALIHAFIWSRQRTAAANLWFAVAAAATAAFAGFELAMMRAPTPAAFAAAMRWGHVPVLVMVVSLVGFIRRTLGGGRAWLAWAACGLRAASLGLNFATGQSLNFRRVTALAHVRLLGEPVAVPRGVANPWMAVGQVAILALVAFVADAAVAAWRRGDRQRAAVVGGSVAFFALAATTQAALVFWGAAAWPVIASPFYLAVVVAMSHELGREALSAARLARDLRATRDQAAHLMRVVTLGELSGPLAHELTQPLAAILANAQAAQRLFANPALDPAAVRADVVDILADIVADDRRAAEVIRRLRDLLRRGRWHPQPLAPADLVDGVLQLLAADLAARGITVTTAVPPGLPAVHADPVQIQQVLINLILNAADAMAAASPRALTIALAHAGGPTVECSVADTGPGLPPGSEEVMFQPYHSTKPNGLGLGLSLSRSIVVAHGGRMWADIRPAGGAVVRFTLPVQSEGLPESVGHERPAPVPNRLPG